ncbi:hypothetical protein QS306_04845 [Paraburkholderia bonniea]|uniref:hypothetical protein n=1 Tax=Paraburkholderia bonniea TaxID=2152891 RepID=UPI0012925424|nr:hypothetical protein [Paraburkholderia bonniea]WJF90989.1 hypothetical protein QS306_04845 [Paraburkholderia bonniea]WJF94303.1 hypothetical protein QS308_04850 [Paraburkholderia bonniea]
MLYTTEGPVLDWLVSQLPEGLGPLLLERIEMARVSKEEQKRYLLEVVNSAFDSDRSDIIRAALARHSSAAATLKEIGTPILQAATCYRGVASVQVLIGFGFDVNGRTSKGEPLASWVSRKSRPEVGGAALRELLCAGAEAAPVFGAFAGKPVPPVIALELYMYALACNRPDLASKVQPYVGNLFEPQSCLSFYRMADATGQSALLAYLKRQLESDSEAQEILIQCVFPTLTVLEIEHMRCDELSQRETNRMMLAEMGQRFSLGNTGKWLLMGCEESLWLRLVNEIDMVWCGTFPLLRAENENYLGRGVLDALEQALMLTGPGSQANREQLAEALGALGAKLRARCLPGKASAGQAAECDLRLKHLAGVRQRFAAML